MSESDVLSWFLNHLWQSTLFRGARAGLVVSSVRTRRVRYNIWLCRVAEVPGSLLYRRRARAVDGLAPCRILLP
jgi:hypothetical protein